MQKDITEGNINAPSDAIWITTVKRRPH